MRVKLGVFYTAINARGVKLGHVKNALFGVVYTLQ